MANGEQKNGNGDKKWERLSRWIEWAVRGLLVGLLGLIITLGQGVYQEAQESRKELIAIREQAAARGKIIEANQQRIEALAQKMIEVSEGLVEAKTQYAALYVEINRRLDRIENKLDRR